MTPLNTIINFSYLVAFITTTPLGAHYVLTDMPGYTSKWQAIGIGISGMSLLVVAVHLLYIELADTHMKDNK